MSQERFIDWYGFIRTTSISLSFSSAYMFAFLTLLTISSLAKATKAGCVTSYFGFPLTSTSNEMLDHSKSESDSLKSVLIFLMQMQTRKWNGGL